MRERKKKKEREEWPHDTARARDKRELGRHAACLKGRSGCGCHLAKCGQVRAWV